MFVALLTGKALAKVRPPVSKEQPDCDVVYNQANERFQTSQLIEARELAAKCAQEVCGSFLSQACTSLYAQIDADLPSVVPIVTDNAGAAMSLVEVKMDGELLTSKLDGLSFRIDPGKHDFSFSTDSGVFATRKVMILQGEHNRPISVLLRAPRRKTFVASGMPLSEVAHKAVAPPAPSETPARKIAAPREIADSEVSESDAVLAKNRRAGDRRSHRDQSL
jgi:hypothetical protein